MLTISAGSSRLESFFFFNRRAYFADDDTDAQGKVT